MKIRKENMKMKKMSLWLGLALSAGFAGAESADRRESAPWLRVEPGTFTMGALPGADCLKPRGPVEAVNVQGKKVKVDEYQGPHWDEHPVHEVHITRAFEMSARRVTLGEFLRFKPEHAEVVASRSLSADPGAPVTLVTWDEAQGYCQWLGKAEGSICRLPTEAEWEIAAGPASASGLEGLGDGIREWCFDWWAQYIEADETDPLGPADGIVRVIRGRVNDLGNFRITDRSGGLPGERLPNVSFRVARVHGTAGGHRVSPPPDAVFRDVVQAPKAWKRPGKSDTPVFHGGQIYISKSQDNAANLPHWGRHHVPSITWCDNGDLLATVMTSPNDGSDQMAVLLTRLRDGADTWDPPARFFILPDRDVDAAILHRADDGVLYHFNAMGKGELADFAARSVSRDNGATWSRPEIVRFHRFTEGADDGFRSDLAFIHMDLVILNDGALAMARDVVGPRPYGTALFKSADHGMSWHEMTRLGWQAGSFAKKGEQAGWIAGWHAAVAALRDGSFLAVGRTGDIDGRAPISRTIDQGRTWTYSASDLSPISSSQRPIIKRLAEGPLMLVHYTDSSDITRNKEPEQGIEIRDAAGTPRRMFGTFTALSFDEGATWSHHKPLPVRAETPLETDRAGYYSATQSPDGMIHLISTHRYYRFNLAWLKEPMPAEQ